MTVNSLVQKISCTRASYISTRACHSPHVGTPDYLLHLPPILGMIPSTPSLRIRQRIRLGRSNEQRTRSVMNGIWESPLEALRCQLLDRFGNDGIPSSVRDVALVLGWIRVVNLWRARVSSSFFFTAMRLRRRGGTVRVLLVRSPGPS